MPGAIYNYFAGLYSDMLQIGKNIIIGIWNGLVSMASWLYHQLTSLISSISPGPIKSVLGISSPSKLMHSYGQFVGQGLANGIKATYGQVASAAKGLAATVSQHASATATAHIGVSATGSSTGHKFAVSGAGGFAANGGGGGAQVINNYFTVNVDGSIISENQLYDTIQKLTLRYQKRNGSNGLALA